MLHLSTRSTALAQSEIRNMSLECERVNGINLSQGVCDTETPNVVREGAHAAIERGENVYTRFDGTADLRAAIVKKLARDSAIQAAQDGEIIVSAGSTGAFYSACLALLNPGDEVVLFEPYYGYHLNTILAAGAQARFVRLDAPDWSFSEAALRAAIGPRTRAIMICTPSNPCGKVWSRSELQQVAVIAREFDLFVFSDEVYEYFVYDGRTHLSPYVIPELRDRTIAMFSLSKTFSVTGWRVGYSVSAAQWAKPIGYMNDLVYVCAPSPLQAGVARGMLELPPTYYADLRDEYRVKRDKLCEVLDKVGITPHVPQGAYYVLADVSKLDGNSSKDRAMTLLKRTGVASVPGEAFYHDSAGELLVRFCFAKRAEELDAACDRLGAL